MPIAPVHRQPAPPAGDWPAGGVPEQGSDPGFEGETETAAETAAEAEFASADAQWQETDDGPVETETPPDPNQR